MRCADKEMLHVNPGLGYRVFDSKPVNTDLQFVYMEKGEKQV